MEFDPVGSAQSIPHMIKNDTLTEVLDQDQLSECLKHITLNVDDSLYILKEVQSKYDIPDRLKAIQHIFTDFGENDKLDSKKFVEFIKSLGRCLHLDILDSIATIIESIFYKIDQLFVGIKQSSRITAIGSHIQTHTQQMSTPNAQNHEINKNIEELKKISKTEENFDKIYEICQKITTENDLDAMSFAVREKFVYIAGPNNYNIFTQATFDNKQDLIRLLIESGIDINSLDRCHYTALILASLKGHTEVVKLLLTVPGIDINAKDKGNRTALIYASWKGHYETVKLLLAVPGIDVNAKGIENDTALHWALITCHNDIAKLLLTVPGIDVNVKLISNNTPLILAPLCRDPEIVKLLLTFPGIDVNAKNENNETALICASFSGHHEVVKLLLAVPGIDVNAKDKNNETVLMKASRFGQHEVVKLLLAVPGIDVNAKNNRNQTALIFASFYGNDEVVKLLLAVPGIDVNAKDNENKSALIWASNHSNYEIVKMLKDHGAI